MVRLSKLIVIGNGMVGAKFLDLLCQSPARELYEIQVFGAEPQPAYDRVALSRLFADATPQDLELYPTAWYKEQGIELHLNCPIERLDLIHKTVQSKEGILHPYDKLVIASGSKAFIPPVEGLSGEGVFTYRDLADVDSIQTYGKKQKNALVIGGGLLGLEAAKALNDFGLTVTILEAAPRLMPMQLDNEGAQELQSQIEDLGLKVMTQALSERVEREGAGLRLHLRGGKVLPTDMIVVSAGIRPQDELARQAGLALGERGGIKIDHNMQTSEPNVFALGEVASFAGQTFGLVAPGYQMARAAVAVFNQEKSPFELPNISTKLKLLGVEVASFGDALEETPGCDALRLSNPAAGMYKKLVFHPEENRLLGGVLVGDVSEFGKLSQLVQREAALPPKPEELLFPTKSDSSPTSLALLPSRTVICNCENLTKGKIIETIRAQGITNLADLKKATRGGTGCGGCSQLLTDLLNLELEGQGVVVNKSLCEHFAYTRTELYAEIKKGGYHLFSEVLSHLGSGKGCEVCKPVVANLLATLWNDSVMSNKEIQDTNDAFLANIQVNGSYSVIPRMPGGETTAEGLIAIGEVAKEFNLYVKLTGGERIALFGASLEDLPKIWGRLIAAGFESGHAYGKSLRTVKSCVGSTWCHLGVGDSLDMAVTLENRYKSLRGPHKMKGAASGCMRECAEANCKDFGLIATEKGWNLFVGGNGGIKPQHGQLLAADITKEEAIRYIDRYLIYYFRTADKLTRTSTWLSLLEGGIERLKEIIVQDSLGIAAELEAEMERLVANQHCEWKRLLADPPKLSLFRPFLNSDDSDESIRFQEKRSQVVPLLTP